MIVFVENHYRRDASRIMAEIQGQSYVPRLVTDRTDYYHEKGHQRWRGNFKNYFAILKAGVASGHEWVVVLQDDVSIPPRLFERIRYVADHAPDHIDWMGFYVPQNKLYAEALAHGASVVQTYQNFWIQAMLFRSDRLQDIVRWATAHADTAWDQCGDGPSDDDTLNLYGSIERHPCSVILPSFVQHLGAGESLMNTPAKVGKYERVSACYAPDFDPATVDWTAAFTAPVIDRSRISSSDPRHGRLFGL